MNIQDLPKELLSLILSNVLDVHWPSQDTAAKRHEVLTVSKRFHDLGRPHLYKQVILSSRPGFHTFFLVDEADFAESRLSASDMKRMLRPMLESQQERWTKKWRDSPETLRRRKADWSCTQHLLVDMHWTDSEVMPLCINTYGQEVTLEDDYGRQLLPNLQSLTECNSQDDRDRKGSNDRQHWIRAKRFRREFYGRFSPRSLNLPGVYHIPVGVILGVSYPSTLLLRTVNLVCDEPSMLPWLFPIPQDKFYQESSEHIGVGRISSASVLGDKVERVICGNYRTLDPGHRWARFRNPDFIERAMRSLLLRFPNLRHLHLPLSPLWPEELDAEVAEKLHASLSGRESEWLKQPQLLALEFYRDQEIAFHPNPVNKSRSLASWTGGQMGIETH